MLEVLTLFLFNIIVYNIPLLYGTTGEIMTEKAGSLNLGVEGTMAIGAVAGYLVGAKTDSLFVACLVSFIASGLVGLLFSFLTVTLQANQNVTGEDELTVRALSAKALGLGVTAVLGRTHTLFMSEELDVYFQHVVTPPFVVAGYTADTGQ